MMLDWLTVFAIVVGHLSLFVLSLNLSHSTNLPEKWLTIENLVLLVATLVALPFLVLMGPWTAWVWPARAYALLCLGVTLLGIPAATLLRLCRRQPDCVRVRRTEVDLGDESLVGEGKHRGLLLLPGNHALRLERVESEIRLGSLPDAFDGLSVVHLTDTHFAHCYQRRYFERVAEEASRWEADLVVFTGDLLDDPATLDWVEPVFSRLRGRLGQFAIRGNHDHRLRPGRARRALRKAGFEDLEGRWERIDLGEKVLAIGGTSAPWGPALDWNSPTATEADFRLLLTHSPDQFPVAARHKVELTLAGHNHGGQIRFPILGPILMPSRYSRHFDRGFFQSGASLMYVSQGIGGKHPIRYGCTPEVTRFLLRSTQLSPAQLENAGASLGHRLG